MKKSFADAQYFVALINDKDQAHPAALAMSQALQGETLVTTEEALSEVLAYFAERGPYLRQVAVAYVEDILSDPDMVIRDNPINLSLTVSPFTRPVPTRGIA